MYQIITSKSEHEFDIFRQPFLMSHQQRRVSLKYHIVRWKQSCYFPPADHIKRTHCSPREMFVHYSSILVQVSEPQNLINAQQWLLCSLNTTSKIPTPWAWLDRPVRQGIVERAYLAALTVLFLFLFLTGGSLRVPKLFPSLKRLTSMCEQRLQHNTRRSQAS